MATHIKPNTERLVVTSNRYVKRQAGGYLAVPSTEGLDGTAQHDDLLEDVGVWHNAIKTAHLCPPALHNLAWPVVKSC